MPRQGTGMFPGERGFALVVAEVTFLVVGMASKKLYAFEKGEEQYIDRRDMPGLPRNVLKKVE